MKIAHLDGGRTWRGGQAQVLHLLRGLAAAGHRSLLLAAPGPLLERAAAADIATAAWPISGDADVVAMARAARAVARFAPDVVHAHDARAHLSAIVAARGCRAAVVIARRVALPVGRHALSRLKYRFAVDRYVCVSAAVRDMMARSGIAPERLTVVPSGVDLAGPEPGAEDLRTLIGAPSRADVVITVAAVSEEKDPGTWIAAATRLSATTGEAYWVWVGDGPLRAACQARVSGGALAGRVHFLGERADARGLLAQATVFVLCSRHEGLGTAVLDAQALGVPVVATAVGGVPEIVTNGVSGALVAPGDPEALAAAVHRTLMDREAAGRWRGAARRAVEGRGIEVMVGGTVEVYESVLSRRRSRAW